MKIKHSYIYCWVVIITVGIAFGLATRFSYSTFSIDDINYTKVSVRAGSSDIKELIDMKYLRYQSLDELYRNSDLIVKVLFTGERQPHNDSVFTTVKVLDAIKGDIKVNSNIFVYELSYFGDGKYEGSFFVKGCYNLMKKDTEYVLFLNHRKFDEKYNQSEIEKNTYMINNGAFGKYNITNSRPIKLLDMKKQYAYSEVVSEEILTTNQDVLNLYNELKACINSIKDEHDLM